MEKALSLIGLINIIFVVLYIIKMIAEYDPDKDEQTTIYKFDEDDEI
jgi:hypothetical protein